MFVHSRLEQKFLLKEWEILGESGYYYPIIERNTVIPVSRTETFYTCYDGQSKLVVEVLQGESRLAKNNLKLGEISVVVPKGPEGKESIDVTYTYDINSILEVIVKVNSTGEKKKLLSKKKIAQYQKKMQRLDLRSLII